MEKVVIGLTGATGAMGSEAFRQLLEIDAPLYIKLLIRNPRRLSRALRSLIRKQKTRVEVIVASITDKDAVRAFVTGCDYVVHCAALIPPRADHNDAETMATNYTGTQNIIDAIDETHQQSST
ncbi:MAG: polysaccharide biosynthesis protein, partial [Treponema sp.]|nr:polysaccharide biosynthesis protein [Treponema sp.]